MCSTGFMVFLYSGLLTKHSNSIFGNCNLFGMLYRIVQMCLEKYMNETIDIWVLTSKDGIDD